MNLPLSPATTARLLAIGRIAIGVTAYTRPQVGAAAFISRELPTEAIGGWRMVGGRDIALGLGTVMATRRGRRLRGWVEAGALVDLLDVVAHASDKSLRPVARYGGAAVAASAAAIGLAAASELGR